MKSTDVRDGTDARARAAGAYAPFLGRLGGLSADAVERMRTGLHAGLAEDEALERAAEDARAALADHVHGLVPAAERSLRRRLLALRRDCFNGRPLRPHLEGAGADELRAACGAPLERALALEAQRAGREAAFRAAYARARRDETAHLAGVLEDAAFRRGLALASADFADAAERFRREGAEADGGPAPRVRRTLLRYVSRAAVKLSPFGTLTRVALGRVCGESLPSPLTLAGAPLRERSLTRVQPFLLGECIGSLMQNAAFRAGLEVALNRSAVPLSGGRVLLVRPDGWEPSDQEGLLRFSYMSLVKVAVGGPLVEWARRTLAAGPMVHGRLLEALASEFPELDPARLAEAVDRLIQLGLLARVPPWSGGEARLEEELLRYLRALPAAEAFAGFARGLERLMELEGEFPRAADPGRVVRQVDEALRALAGEAARLGGSRPPPPAAPRIAVHEDVMAEPAAGGADVVLLARAAAREAVRAVEPLMRLAWLHDDKHAFQQTLRALVERRWPGEPEVGLVHVFHEAQTLLADFQRARSGDAAGMRAWNPMELPELEALGRWRDEATRAWPGCVRADEEGDEVSPERVAALLSTLPARYVTPPVGPCLFMQPADPRGERWVLNSAMPGTGRYGSRFTPLMEPEARRAYTDRLAACGTLRLDGEPVELLDLHCVRGSHVNTHAVQTPAVLLLPGARADLPPERCVALDELRLCLRRPGQLALRDGRGRRFLPMHLGFAGQIFMPTLIRFLSLLGPNGGRLPLPAQSRRPVGPAVTARRLSSGPLVVHRASWTVPREHLLPPEGRGDDAAAFAHVNRRRMALGIPDRVFLQERMEHPIGVRLKPQYVDFTAPAFVDLLLSAVRAAPGPVLLTEALPAPDAFPADAEGRRRAVEVVLDTLCASGAPSGRTVRVRRGAGPRLRELSPG